MTFEVLVLGFAVLVTLVAAAMRAASASLVRTPRADAVHDAAEGDKRAAIVASLLDDRAAIQPSLAMVHSGLLVVAALAAAWGLARLFSGPVFLIITILVGLLIVFGGDILPRSIGRSRPRTLAYRYAWALRRGIAFGSAANDLLDEELPDMPDEQDDEADVAEKELISSVLEFTDTIVREVMVPRPDMVVVYGAESTDDALDVILAEGRSRVPVVGEGVDDIKGILYARDLLQMMDEAAEPRPAGELIRPAYFVPETKRVSELLREMQSNQVHLAIVVDEFGGTAGLVTIEDLLEEIVGEIVDEYDNEAPMATDMGDGTWLIDARMGVDELGELLGAELPADEWDTVGGLILGLAGRLPREGEAFRLDDYELSADRVQGRRVARVRVKQT